MPNTAHKVYLGQELDNSEWQTVLKTGTELVRSILGALKGASLELD